MAVDRNARADPMIAGMRVGNERFQSIRNVLHRPAQQLGNGRYRNLVAIGMELDTEGPTDIGAYDLHFVFREIEKAREYILHLIRRLMRLVNSQHFRRRIVVGDDFARLQRHTGVSAEIEVLRHDMIRPTENVVDGTGLNGMRESEIAAEIIVDQRGARFERSGRIDHRGERFDLNSYFLRRIFGKRPCFRDDRSERFALPAHMLHGQRPLKRRFQGREISGSPLKRPAHVNEIAARDHANDTGGGSGLNGVQAHNTTVSMGASHKCDVNHPRQHNVVDITAAPSDQTPCMMPGHRLADRPAAANGHGPDPFRPACVSAIASTIA